MIDSEAAAREWLVQTLRIDDAAMARLAHLVTLLTEENERQNLVSRGSLSAIWQRHVVDSAQLLDVPHGTIPQGTWLDLGSGAGFPGLVIAALQPDRPVVLAESRRLRCEWLARAAEMIGLANVKVRHGRVEDLQDFACAVISARAFAPMERLLALSARFSTPDTLWLLPKGASAAQELASIDGAWQHMFHVEQSLTDPTAGVIVGHLLGRRDASPRDFRKSAANQRQGT